MDEFQVEAVTVTSAILAPGYETGHLSSLEEIPVILQFSFVLPPSRWRDVITTANHEGKSILSLTRRFGPS